LADTPGHAAYERTSTWNPAVGNTRWASLDGLADGQDAPHIRFGDLTLEHPTEVVNPEDVPVQWDYRAGCVAGESGARFSRSVLNSDFHRVCWAGVRTSEISVSSPVSWVSTSGCT
jgi:hypothetical protein